MLCPCGVPFVIIAFVNRVSPITRLILSPLQDILTSHDRSLLVTDPRRCEPKKCGLLQLLLLLLLIFFFFGSPSPSLLSHHLPHPRFPPGSVVAALVPATRSLTVDLLLLLLLRSCIVG
jgi:hypothetical protein